MWQIFCTLLITAITLISAQQEPIYVPFEWDQVPATATPLSVSGSTTTFILLEGRRSTLGPATLIQGPSAATMTYVAPTATLSGVCDLRSPIAMCALNVYETGAVFPPTGIQAKGSETAAPSTGISRLGSATSSMGGFMLALSTVVLGFAISVVLLQ